MADFRWSFTKLKKYEKCPFAYKCRYELKLPDPSGKAAQRGTDMHDISERFVKGELAELPSDFNHTNYIVGFKERKADTEKEFYFDNTWELTDKESYWCMMKLDVVEIQGNTATVWDYKSGKFYPDHYDQLMFYGMGALIAYPEAYQVLTGAIYIDQPTTLPIQRTQIREQLPSLKEHYENRLKVLLNDDKFEPVVGKHCLWCNYSKKKGGPCRY